MKKMLPVALLLLSGCGTMPGAHNNVTAGMDKREFCRQFNTVIDWQCGDITYWHAIEYFPEYKTEIYPSEPSYELWLEESPSADTYVPSWHDPNKKRYWYVFKDVENISHMYAGTWDTTGFGTESGTFLMVTDSYREAYSVATHGALDKAKKVTEKLHGGFKQEKNAENGLVEALVEGLIDEAIDQVVDQALGLDCDPSEIKVRSRTRPRVGGLATPTGERREIIVSDDGGCP